MNAGVVSGLVEFLEAKPGVRDVKVVVNRPVTPTDLSAWEQGTRCVLPEDLKQFLCTHNGLNLTWSYQDNGRTVGLGRISVNSLAQLKQLQTTSPTSSKPSLHDLDTDRGIEAGSKELPWRPGFGADCKIFPLDYCSTCGHTCLVYDVAPSNEHADGSCSDCSVWLLDLSLQWHRLSDSFSEYFRQAVVHLGLRQWPYALTTNHLSPQYERWFHVFIPKRLQLDHTHLDSPSLQPSTSLTDSPGTSSERDTPPTTFVNSLDITRLLQNAKTTREKRSRDAKPVQPSSKRSTGGTQHR